MCLAFPGKIIAVKNGMATVDYGAEKRQAKLVDKRFKKGDFVIVQNKIAVEKIPKKSAEEWLKVITGNGLKKTREKRRRR